MSTTTKIQHKGQVTIPTQVREQAGLSKGDLVEFSFHRGKIVITPLLVIDRSKFPNADDEYTPEQRRVIDTQLAKADADIKAGRVSRTFNTAEEFIADLHKASAKLSAKKHPKRAGR
jgi:AbrB family looped-hinge helix DNA binding protein